VWWYIQKFIRRYSDKKLSKRIHFLEETDSFMRPLNAPLRWEMGMHGHNADRGHRKGSPAKAPQTAGMPKLP